MSCAMLISNASWSEGGGRGRSEEGGGGGMLKNKGKMDTRQHTKFYLTVYVLQQYTIARAC